MVRGYALGARRARRTITPTSPVPSSSNDLGSGVGAALGPNVNDNARVL